MFRRVHRDKEIKILLNPDEENSNFHVGYSTEGEKKTFCLVMETREVFTFVSGDRLYYHYYHYYYAPTVVVFGVALSICHV
jgi:hypothetical protein